MTMPAPASAPWWRHGHVWMIIAGPVIVIIAGLTTAFIAIRSPDPVVAEDYYRQGLEINKTLAARQQQQPGSLSPALQARNHAATMAPADR